MAILGMKAIDYEAIAKSGLTNKEKKVAITLAIVDFFKNYVGPAVKQISTVRKLEKFGQKSVAADAALMGDIPVVNVHSDFLKEIDLGWQAIFRMVDQRLSTNKTLNVLDTTGGITYRQKQPGEKTQISNLPKGARSALAMLAFDGGFSILDEWLDFNEFHLIDELVENAIIEWWDGIAVRAYGLLTAIGSGINEVFDTDDVTTINNGVVNLVKNLRAKGFKISGDTVSVVLTADLGLKARLQSALEARFANPNTNNKQIVFTIERFVTTTHLETDKYYISIAGRKNIYATWKDLTSESQRDAKKQGEDLIWHGRYNLGIFEDDQHRRLSLS